MDGNKEVMEPHVVRPEGIVERTVSFSLEVIRFTRTVQRDDVGQVLCRQVLRAATSVGANVHEAQAGQSRADVLCKMQIAHKEARETAYWLRLLRESNCGQADLLASLQDETAQLIRILTSIILTAKAHQKSPSLHPSPKSCTTPHH